MRILNVGQTYRVTGGADRYFLSLGELLERRGHDVVPFAARHPDNRGTEWSEFYPPGVDTESPGWRDISRFVFSRPAREGMSRLLSEWTPELVHLHVYYGQLTASILQPIQESGVPVVQTLHDCKLGCPVRTFLSRGEVCEACGGSQFWQALPRRCNQGSLLRTSLNVLEAYVSRWSGDVDSVDHFIAPSGFLHGKMLEHEIMDPASISILPNFVDPEQFDPASALGEHFVYVGRMRDAKGIGTLVRASAGGPEVPLLMVGTGRDRDALEAWTDEEGLDHVKFVGFREGRALHRLIRKAIAVILPAEQYENCPMTVLEAMALGRPVIGTDMGGIPELVRHKTDGLLFPPGDVVRLREHLAWMADHPEEAAATGRAGRRKIVERSGLGVVQAEEAERRLEILEESGTVDLVLNHEGTILEAEGQTDEWQLKVRFADREQLGQFHGHFQAKGKVEMTQLLSPSQPHTGEFDLTVKQREALVAAYEAGYYEVPRETTASELADEFDISQQAFSQRLDRGTANFIENALLTD
jgi:glycosyltransferase involved in cell wall biosynthesis